METAVVWCSGRKTGSSSFCNQTPEGLIKLVRTSYDKNHQQEEIKNGTVLSETLFHSQDLFAVQ